MQNLNVDRTSTDVLKYFHPPMLEHYNPSEIMGDGNCLYRAMSLAIAGLEKYHVLLRLFTSQNRNFYDTRKIHKYNIPKNMMIGKKNLTLDTKKVSQTI